MDNSELLKTLEEALKAQGELMDMLLKAADRTEHTIYQLERVYESLGGVITYE